MTLTFVLLWTAVMGIIVRPQKNAMTAILFLVMDAVVHALWK